MSHDRRAHTHLRPLSIDFTMTPQFDARPSLLSAGSGSGFPRVAAPGGASVWVKDSAGTSMALNLDIHPVYGTPLLSGQAITAQGDVLDVHPCSCNDPIASRHNFPMSATPEPSRDKSLFQNSHDSYPTPNSRILQVPGSTRTPPQFISPPHATELLQELEIPPPAPGTNAYLGSPITPTPFSVRCNTHSTSTAITYRTTQEDMGEPSAPPTPPNAHTPPPVEPLSLQCDEPPRLGRIPTQSTFNPDLEIPTVLSPASVGPFSGISEPSVIGPLPSLLSSSSGSSPECSPCTVLAFSRPAIDLLQNQTPTASNFNRTPSRGSGSQDGRGPSAAVETLPEQPEGTIRSNDDTTGTRAVPITTGVTTDLVDPPENETDSTSDLYTDRIAVSIPMPLAMIGPEGEGLRFESRAQSEPGPTMNGFARPPSPGRAPHMGKIRGTWVANRERDHVALKLDLTLVKLGLNPSLSTSLESPPCPGLGTRPSANLWPHTSESEDGNGVTESTCSQSIVSIGSRPSTVPTLSDLPLTPIPELLRTPTKHSTLFADAPTILEPSFSRTSAHLNETQRNLVSRLPAPHDNGPIVAQLVQGEYDVRAIQTALRHLANEWHNVQMMPDGVALRDVEDDCTALYHTLVDLTPIIMLTWPSGRQPSLGTEGQPPAREQLLHLEHMGEREHKWYLKQHEFTTSLQRNLSRLTLLAQRVVEDPDAAYRSNVLERISQFMEKFEDLALRLKLAHHIRVEQKYRARVRHAARRAIASPEQGSAYEYLKAKLVKVRQDIEEIACDARRRRQWR